MRPFECSQRDVALKLDGSIEFVGAIPSLDVFIVARVPDESDDTYGRGMPPKATINTIYRSHEQFFHEIPYGPIVFIASDMNGEEIDVDVPAFLALCDRCTTANV